MVRGVGTVGFLYLTLVPTDEKKMRHHVRVTYINILTVSLVCCALKPYSSSWKEGQVYPSRGSTVAFVQSK